MLYNRIVFVNTTAAAAAETWRECFVHQHGVMTFDGLTVTYRPTQSDVLVRDGCEVILTQDCSGAGLFAVLSARTPTSWKLRFLVPGQEIKYVWRGVMSVTVNGDVKNFEPSQEIVIREVPVDLRYHNSGLTLSFVYRSKMISQINVMYCVAGLF